MLFRYKTGHRVPINKRHRQVIGFIEVAHTGCDNDLEQYTQTYDNDTAYIHTELLKKPLVCSSMDIIFLLYLVL